MTTQSLHAKPARGAIVREQIRSVGLSARIEMIVFVGLLLLVGGLLLENRSRHPQASGLDMLPELALPLLYLAFVVPLSIWKDEGPSRRSYHLAMPVERSWHQLVRNASGWLWLMGTVAVYLLWVAALAALTDGRFGEESMRIFVGSDWENRTDADYREFTWTVPAWQWAVPFVGATAAYLIGSAIVLAVDHPWRWFAGIVTGFFFLVAVADGSNSHGMEEALKRVVDGRYGLETLFTGETRQDTGIVQPANQRQRLVEVVTPEGVQRLPLHREERPDAGPRTISRDMPDARAWLGSVAIWMGIGLAGTLSAAYRHRSA